MQSTPSLPSLLGPLWPRVVAPHRVLPIGQIELNCILMLNWTGWNRTVLTCKLPTYAQLILNWIVWTWSVWLNWIAWHRTVFDN